MGSGAISVNCLYFQHLQNARRTATYLKLFSIKIWTIAQFPIGICLNNILNFWAQLNNKYIASFGRFVGWFCSKFTATFNNMRTLKAQPTNVSVNQMFAGSSQLSTAAERAVIKSLCRRSSDNEQSLAVVVSWEDPPNTWLTAAKNAFVGWALILESACHWKAQ